MHTQRNLAELCAEHQLTLEELARRTGLEQRRVAAIVEGRWLPSPEERDQIAAVFGLTRDQIAWGHRAPIAHLYGHGPQFGRSP